MHARRPPKIIVLDMDSSESPTYGEQEGSATMALRLHLLPRPGNVHSAAEWRAVLEPVIARYRDAVKRLYFRGDAAFANPEMYKFLEAERIG